MFIKWLLVALNKATVPRSLDPPFSAYSAAHPTPLRKVNRPGARHVRINILYTETFIRYWIGYMTRSLLYTHTL